MISRLSDVSLRNKIIISFLLIVISGTSISTFLGSKIITNAMLNEALKQIHHGLVTAEMVYEDRQREVLKSVSDAAQSEVLAAALAHETRKPSPQVLARLRDDNQLHFLAYVANDRSITRAANTSADQNKPVPHAISLYLSNALSGRALAGTELFTREALAAEDPALSDKARIAVSSGAHEKIEDGLVLIAASPATTAAGPAGVLYGGILLNRNSELVNQIDGFVFGEKKSIENGAGTVSIFMNDVMIATNIRGRSGLFELGTRISTEAQRSIVSKDKSYFGSDYFSGSRYLTAYQPIHNYSGRQVGILRVGIPEDPFLEVRSSMMYTFLFVAGIGVLVVLAITFFITRSMIYPLEEMVKASNRIAAGDLDHSVSITSNDEIGILADSFNKMLASIKTMKVELEEWGRTLEEKVNKRTEELVAVQIQMAQSEKLASIGRLAAGVAHEINNPLGGILTFSMLALEDCDNDHPMKQSLEVIVKQTLRCRETVKGLLDFARQSSTTPSLTEVNSIVDKTLMFLENQTMFQNVRTIRKFSPGLPNVLIDSGQLQQVVINIVINAVDAMEESGVLIIETSAVMESHEILIRISDTGKGIPDDALPFIFEPFFTTKKVGKGTGLGLAIVHGIVTRAGGKIEVTSSPHGAAFTIRLPIAQEDIKKLE
jgi:two-component system, NtrC family, sensor kinase